MSRTVVTIVAALLALLLVVYVFAGGSSGNRGMSTADAKARCSSQRTYDGVKRELFRRAAQLRGGDRPAFERLSGYSAARMQSPLLRSRDDSSRTIGCRGALAIDLPPGVEAVGGRRSLAGDVGYTVRAGANGGSDVLTLTNADALINLLATIGRSGGNAGGVQSPPVIAAPAAPAGQPQTSQEAPAQTAPPAPAPTPARTAVPAARVNAAPPRQRDPRSTASAPPPKTRAAPVLPRRPAVTAARTTARPGGGPSYNCRYARTAAEIGVCNDAYLGALDRQMAGMFNRGLRSGTPAQRELLQRTRTRFLGYREACRTPECIANSYRSRMVEISDIMAGRWRVP